MMKGQRIGYIRVSSLGQNTDRQLEGVQIDRTFTDKVSGKDINRPKLQEMLEFVREGDTVVVHSMDRLARNLDDLRRTVQQLTKKGVAVEFMHEHLTFTGEDTPMANLLLSVMGAFAEFERALIRERQLEGIALAKQRGGVQRAEEGIIRGSNCSTPPTAQHWHDQSSASPRVRHQPGNTVPILTSIDVGVGLAYEALPGGYYCQAELVVARERICPT